MPELVRITDVSPRDGLQNEPGVIPTADKVELISLLCMASVNEIEIASFVSPKWVPQLADAAEVVRWLFPREMFLRLLSNWRGTDFSALVPNEIGWKTLCEVDQKLCDDLKVAEPDLWKRSHVSHGFVSKISVFTSASETFNKRNINATIDESIARFVPVVSDARSKGRDVRGYISCAVACPFEGPTDPSRVAAVAERLVSIGVTEIDLGDTIGAGTPDNLVPLLKAIQARFDTRKLRSLPVTLHLHDTFGRAADCVRAALDLGIRSFDGSVAGLGGCPYAGTPGNPAPGNISTETLVRTIHEAGYETWVNLDALAKAAEFARKITGR